MNDDFVIDTLLGYFNSEVSNKVEKKSDGLIITLADGTKAKIGIISLS